MSLFKEEETDLCRQNRSRTVVKRKNGQGPVGTGVHWESREGADQGRSLVSFISLGGVTSF